MYYRLRLAYKKKTKKKKKKNFPKENNFFLPFFYATFQCGRYNVFKFIFFDRKKLKNPPQKVAHNQPRPFFFSAALPAQNSPELNIHFIDSCIQ